MIEAELDASLDREALRQFSQPVYLPVGGRSHPRFLAIADVLAETFPNASLEVFEQREHFDPPHRAEPERFARALLNLWAPSHLG
jgi:pimeloyl-ACP methyl ester carboxylesterase